MITIDRIEQATVRLIKAALPEVHVEAYPANARQFVENFRHLRGAVLVQYTGRDRKHLAETRGNQIVFVEISVIAKNLREHSGIYPLLDATFVAVSGASLTEEYDTGDPENPKALRGIGVTLYQEEEGFAAYLDKYGLWIYTQKYKSNEFPFLLPEEEPEALITQIMLQAGNTIEITVPEPVED